MNNTKSSNSKINEDKKNFKEEEKPTILGRRVKNLREAQGFSTAELAKKIEKSKATVVMYETGSRFPQIKDVHILAKVLNTSTSYLIGETDLPSPALTKNDAKSLVELIKIHVDSNNLKKRDQDILNKLEELIKTTEKII
ncbi:helix-turn-helix domain-containing protein [Priestia megaterium]|uniref:helix-turn-helix domain-containing protein n=1 Tax=Priestia megaterium TaxID=1404 RepID=UPI0037C9EAF2